MILRGKLPKLDEKLFIDSLNYHVKNNHDTAPIKEEKLITLLNHEVIDSLNRKEKLNNVDSFSSLGEYLKVLIIEQNWNTEVLCQTCNIEKSNFLLLLENKIMILDFGAKKIAQLAKHLNLKIKTVKELLEKTIWLNSYNFSDQKALTGFNQLKGDNKSKTSEKYNNNFNELVNTFLNNFEKHYNSL